MAGKKYLFRGTWRAGNMHHMEITSLRKAVPHPIFAFSLSELHTYIHCSSVLNALFNRTFLFSLLIFRSFCFNYYLYRYFLNQHPPLLLTLTVIPFFSLSALSLCLSLTLISDWLVVVDVLCYLLVCDISLCQPPQLFRGREVLVTNCRGSCSLIPKLAT